MLLVVPENGSEWQESILQPITYSIVPRFTLLAELAEMDPDGVSHGRWQDAMRRAVDGGWRIDRGGRRHDYERAL